MLEGILRWLIASALCATAATCGQKGPLELPDEAAVAAFSGVSERPRGLRA